MHLSISLELQEVKFVVVVAEDTGTFPKSLDPSGKVVFRVGHGNVDRPETETEICNPHWATTCNRTNSNRSQNRPAETRQDFLKRYMQDQLQTTLMQQLLNPQQQTNHQAVMEQMMQSMGGLGILQNPMSV
jgi:hypothetical protein